jgi:hypothetical protein
VLIVDGSNQQTGNAGSVDMIIRLDLRLRYLPASKLSATPQKVLLYIVAVPCRMQSRSSYVVAFLFSEALVWLLGSESLRRTTTS